MYISKNSKITTDFNLEDTRKKDLPLSLKLHITTAPPSFPSVFDNFKTQIILMGSPLKLPVTANLTFAESPETLGRDISQAGGKSKRFSLSQLAFLSSLEAFTLHISRTLVLR